MNPGGKQNPAIQGTNKPLEVGGFKITFRTMPQDMESLGLSEATILRPKKILSEQLPKTKSASAEDLYREAKSLYHRKFYQAAIEKLEELISLQRGHLRAQWLLYRARNKFRKYQLQEQSGPSARDYAILATTQKEAREKMEKTGYALPIATSPPLPATPEKPLREAEKARLLEQIRQEEQRKIQLLQETRERELAERKLAEEMERRKQEVVRLQEERKRAHLQEKLMQEKGERELAERKLAEEMERQEQLKKQLQETTAVSPPPGPQPAQYQMAPSHEEDTVFFLKKRGLNFPSAKTVELIGAIFFIVLISSGLVYWLGWKRLHPSTPSVEQPSTQSGQVLPAALFSVNETLSVSLQIGQKKMLFQELEKISERNQAPGTFARILVKFVSEDGTQNYASLGDLIDSLQTAFPSEILNSLDKNNYMLFLYAQRNLPSSPFAISLGKNKLGLIVTMAKKENMAQKFLSWEKTMPQDLDALFLGKKISFPTQYQFSDIPYREMLIRTFDMPDQFSSLNYTFSDNKIIITTSLETTETLIDKLTPQR
ncbi:MAG: hypothetical protein CO002_01190 [Candidatus Portnoybacteria bacterium CG_4_8_14_3_um_filter_44_10]|uniref:Uncharacterized protein n=6 Tax=Candidatus Portnoyibacteriota TaxID=1817913 RepID=A0A2H0KRQ0_9BACT|nr:MAG: hypothetical protein COV85_04005 [Candidatus Portnoybacteria bacterium CG11_big_fil_rev_8_21_14_0_20_44_10]PIS16334.1 MAG: hypothetical protein COT61_04500 [Candidatus Portnoybacteria bacterium CG09_land_8_20_14_0_10_44_13]PIW75591.1 MAG: hypothetical protein CO002_01190 [Candidatus Portnoybacteria bacterium CG_4_8_14_3_um_filter_44_10]PJA63740.1 MAG: hypothetical protein CO161_00175 [Candidatus Portnoybacteria bacterium CG_4_9_14_3_um_filter_44_9]